MGMIVEAKRQISVEQAGDDESKDSMKNYQGKSHNKRRKRPLCDFFGVHLGRHLASIHPEQPSTAELRARLVYKADVEEGKRKGKKMTLNNPHERLYQCGLPNCTQIVSRMGQHLKRAHKITERGKLEAARKKFTKLCGQTSRREQPKKPSQTSGSKGVQPKKPSQTSLSSCEQPNKPSKSSSLPQTRKRSLRPKLRNPKRNPKRKKVEEETSTEESETEVEYQDDSADDDIPDADEEEEEEKQEEGDEEKEEDEDEGEEEEKEKQEEEDEEKEEDEEEDEEEEEEEEPPKLEEH